MPICCASVDETCTCVKEVCGGVHEYKRGCPLHLPGGGKPKGIFVTSIHEIGGRNCTDVTSGLSGSRPGIEGS